MTIGIKYIVAKYIDVEYFVLITSITKTKSVPFWTLSPTTLTYQETEMRTDVVFCTFSRYLLKCSIPNTVRECTGKK